MTLLRMALCVIVVVSTGCQSTEEVEATAEPGDLTGWTRLPIEELTVVRHGEVHEVRVRTSTARSGWTVKLEPWTYDGPPHVLTFDLVGRRSGGTDAEGISVAGHDATSEVVIDHETRWIRVNGVNGSLKYKVPWLPKVAN